MENLDYQKISFRKAIKSDEKLLKDWFNKSHVKEFWDNSDEMWQNVVSYLNENKVLYDYSIGLFENTPYCLIITSDALENDPNAPGSDNHLLPYIEPHGKTITIDFMIGEEKFLGTGLSYITLNKFTDTQEGVSSFLIDPEASNTKAIHVYEKAGFKKVGSYTPKKGYFTGLEHYVMKKKLEYLITKASEKDMKDLLEMALALWPEENMNELIKQFHRILNSSDEIGFICRTNKEAIGFVTLSLRNIVNGAKSSPVGFLEGLYVKESYRRKGIARKLVEIGEKWVKDRGCSQIGSDALDWNLQSILFHEKLGYKKLYTTVNFIKNI